MWAVLAIVVLAAVLVIGSGTGGNADLGTQSVLAAPLLLGSSRRGALRMRRSVQRVAPGAGGSMVRPRR